MPYIIMKVDYGNSQYICSQKRCYSTPYKGTEMELRRTQLAGHVVLPCKKFDGETYWKLSIQKIKLMLKMRGKFLEDVRWMELIQHRI
jgi:hypothetical protein